MQESTANSSTITSKFILAENKQIILPLDCVDATQRQRTHSFQLDTGCSYTLVNTFYVLKNT